MDSLDADHARPVIFIGSSKEGLDVAEALQQGLDYVARPIVWTQGVFRPTQDTLGSLLGHLESVDLAVLVLTPDDLVMKRGRKKKVARDNVVFELGLMMGALGRGRTAFVVPRDTPTELCSDLAGIAPITYHSPRDGDWRAALGSACTTIKQMLAQIDSRHDVRGALADPGQWTYRLSPRLPVTDMYLRTCPDSQSDLIERIERARQKIIMFGLTRNFLLSPEMQDVVLQKAREIPVTLYLMDPDCESRKDRYRMEPMEASMEDPERFKREVLAPLRDLIRRASKPRPSRGAGLRGFLYNFPCSFAIEQIDDSCRVILYGHGKRGTDSPIFVFRSGNPYFEYFTSQLRWLESITPTNVRQPWKQKGTRVRRFR